MSGHVDRRDFLKGLGLAWSAASLGCVPSDTAGGDRATEGSLDPPLTRVGVQLYTLRSLVADDMAHALDRVALVGYEEVEFAGYFGHAPQQVRAWLDASGLAAPSAHVDMNALTADLEQTLAAASAIGHRWLVLPSIPDALRTGDGYREVAAFLNRAGAVAAPAGIRVGYHNHAYEFEAVDDTTGFQILLNHLDDDVVDLEIDLHWSTVGGADAVGLFEAHPGRFPLCHVKDLSHDGRMVDVGAGDIDWSGIFALSERAGLRHYFVEHDQPGDPIASIEASYHYLSGRGA